MASAFYFTFVGEKVKTKRKIEIEKAAGLFNLKIYFLPFCFTYFLHHVHSAVIYRVFK